MPHMCTQCNNIIQDESEYIVEGCPECDNSKWEFIKNNNDKNNTNEEEEQMSLQEKARTETVDLSEISNDNNNVEKYDDVEKIKKELNRQYSGINIVESGHYKINISELYHGESSIIEVGSDGSYKIKNTK